MDLAMYFINDENQLLRYETLGSCPTNLKLLDAKSNDDSFLAQALKSKSQAFRPDNFEDEAKEKLEKLLAGEDIGWD